MSETAAMPDRKSMQAAIKDINAILEPKPKLNVIGGADFLAKQIVGAISACIGADAEGNPTWADPRGGQLQPETIATYEAIVQAQQPNTGSAEPQPEAVEQQTAEVAAAEATGQPEPKTDGEGVYLTDGEECAGFVKSLGPKEGEEACAVCSKLAACAERAAAIEPKPTVKSKKEKIAKPKVEKAEGPGVIGSILEFLKAGPCTKADLLTKLKERFPGREEKSMKSTINVQLPHRMAKEKNVNIVKNDAGQYFIQA